MKFIVKIDRKDLAALRRKLANADAISPKASPVTTFKEVFYVDLGRYGEIDLRKKVKVTLEEK